MIALLDLKTKKVPALFCLLAGFIWFLFDPHIPYALIIGGIFFLIACLSKESIGKGDAVVLLLLGFGMSVTQVLTILCIALFLCGVVLKKAGRKDEIPFVPFLCIGYMGVLFFG